MCRKYPWRQFPGSEQRQHSHFLLLLDTPSCWGRHKKRDTLTFSSRKYFTINAGGWLKLEAGSCVRTWEWGRGSGWFCWSTWSSCRTQTKSRVRVRWPVKSNTLSCHSGSGFSLIYPRGCRKTVEVSHLLGGLEYDVLHRRHPWGSERGVGCRIKTEHMGEFTLCCNCLREMSWYKDALVEIISIHEKMILTFFCNFCSLLEVLELQF